MGRLDDVELGAAAFTSPELVHAQAALAQARSERRKLWTAFEGIVDEFPFTDEARRRLALDRITAEIELERNSRIDFWKAAKASLDINTVGALARKVHGLDENDTLPVAVALHVFGGAPTTKFAIAKPVP